MANLSAGKTKVAASRSPTSGCPPRVTLSQQLTYYWTLAHTGDTDSALAYEGHLTGWIHCMTGPQLAKFNTANQVLNDRTHQQQSSTGGNIHPFDAVHAVADALKNLFSVALWIRVLLVLTGAFFLFFGLRILLTEGVAKAAAVIA